MPDKEITAKHIAKEAGVSPSTVSMVLNKQGEKYRISPETQEKILETAKKMGYTHVARKRRRKRSSNKVICIFCNYHFDRGPMTILFEGVKKFTEELSLGYEVILYPYEIGKFKECANWLNEGFISGAILVALGEDDLKFLEENSFDTPVVLFNRICKGYCSVLIDDYAVGYKAMSIFLQHGLRKFGTISPDYSSRGLSLRNFGFWDRLVKEKLNPEEYTFNPIVFDEDTDIGGYNAMKEILSGETIPNAIFVPSDNMVSGIVRCAHENGIKIPDNLKIISYGDKSINQVVIPSISSFSSPTSQMSYNIAKILYDYIENDVLSDNIKLSFEAEISYRESCPAK